MSMHTMGRVPFRGGTVEVEYAAENGPEPAIVVVNVRDGSFTLTGVSDDEAAELAAYVAANHVFSEDDL